MARTKRILYLSCDGILQPLGFGQVARPVLGLAARGWSYDLVTLEPERPADRVEALSRRLADAGVHWTPLPYRTGGSPIGAAKNLAHPSGVVAKMCLERGVSLVHARSYQAAGIARAVKAVTRTPYLFDTRGFWIDERREQGRWFADDRVYRTAKRVERALYRSAGGAVSLTQLGADDIASGSFGPWNGRPVAAIPTCVDHDEFTMACRAERRSAFADKLVVAWVGSINNWYHIDEGLELFRRVRRRRDDAHLLWLTGQRDVARERLRAAGIDDATVVTAAHDEMPTWMGSIDWGLLLLVETYAKRASMPTKLAEFLASGVRPIHHGCNAEVGDWVKKTGSGLSLDRLDSDALDAAAAKIAEVGRSEAGLVEARQRSAKHFSLAAGVDRYETLLEEMLS